MSHNIQKIRSVAKSKMIGVMETAQKLTLHHANDVSIVLLELKPTPTGYVICKQDAETLPKTRPGQSVTKEWVVEFIRKNKQPYRSNPELRVSSSKTEGQRFSGLKVPDSKADSVSYEAKKLPTSPRKKSIYELDYPVRGCAPSQRYTEKYEEVRLKISNEIYSLKENLDSIPDSDCSRTKQLRNQDKLESLIRHKTRVEMIRLGYEDPLGGRGGTSGMVEHGHRLAWGNRRAHR